MASQAARSWAPPAAAVAPALLLSRTLRDGSGWTDLVVLSLGYVLALAGAAWQARRGLLPPSATVGGFAAGLVLAVPASIVLQPTLGTASVVAAGVLALAAAAGCAALAVLLVPEPVPPAGPP